MAAMFVCYKTPADPAAFDAYYANVHIPIAKKIPGLRKVEITTGPVTTPAGAPTDVYVIAVLRFDDLAALQAAFASPEGKAAAADLANFAGGGADLFISETREV